MSLLKKSLAFKYYLDPNSPTYMNALRSLVRAGYSYNYARSYGSKVFFTEKFVSVLFGLGKARKVNNG